MNTETLERAPELKTERLLLRQCRLEDFEPFADMYASPYARYIGGPCSRDRAWRIFAADTGQWALLGFGPWMIELRDTGETMGLVALNKPLHFPEREIGWMVWQQHQGQGYAFEAAMKAREFAFCTLRWSTAVSYIHPENQRSIALAERLGAVLDPGAKTPNDDPDLVFRHVPGPAR
ncbi:MAG: GNAT family N-acetyltransferase [Rhizobiaceae bacterium]